MTRRRIGDIELDDDPARVDIDAVHGFLSRESYWARGRTRAVQEALVRNAARVVGLYRDGHQLGFARVVSDGHVHAYLADVYVDPGLRGRGLGVELIREAVENGPLRGCRWVLHTRDAHRLYARLGFRPAGETCMERSRPDPT